MRSLRLLIVNPSPVRGGAEELLHDLAVRLPDVGVDPLVACLADGPFVDELEAAGVRVRRVRAGRLRNPLAWARAVRALARLARGADAVVSWQVKGHYYGTVAARLARVPCAWWDHGIRPARGEDRHAIDARLPAAVRADLVIASSDAAAARHPGGIAIHPGIPLEPFQRVPRADARAALGLGEGDLAVGIVGRLQPWKGQHLFLSAAAKVLAKKPDVTFFVIGGSPGGFSRGYEEKLQGLASSLGIAAHVRFLGHRDDVETILPGLDVYVLASDAEPFGIATVEAMAAGVPVVATAAGGTVEIVEHRRTGLLVPSGDVEAMALAVCELLESRDLAASIADAAHRSAVERFSIERCLARFGDTIARLIGGDGA